MTDAYMITSIVMFFGVILMVALLSKERRKTRAVYYFFGKEFIKALTVRDGILFWRFEPSGDSDFHFVPFMNKDGPFYYIDLSKGEGKERVHYKVPKSALMRLRNRLNLALVLEESIAAVPPKVVAWFQNLTPAEKARFANAYITYNGLKSQREHILQQLRLEEDPERVEKLKKRLQEVEDEMAAIKEKWSAVVQEISLDEAMAVVDEKEKKITIYRPIDLDEVIDYLESTRPDELVYTAKKMFVDWQQTALEALKKLVVPKDIKSATKNTSIGKIILLLFGLMVLFVLMAGFLAR